MSYAPIFERVHAVLKEGAMLGILQINDGEMRLTWRPNWIICLFENGTEHSRDFPLVQFGFQQNLVYSTIQISSILFNLYII